MTAVGGVWGIILVRPYVCMYANGERCTFYLTVWVYMFDNIEKVMYTNEPHIQTPITSTDTHTHKYTSMFVGQRSTNGATDGWFNSFSRGSVFGYVCLFPVHLGRLVEAGTYAG